MRSVLACFGLLALLCLASSTRSSSGLALGEDASLSALLHGFDSHDLSSWQLPASEKSEVLAGMTKCSSFSDVEKDVAKRTNSSAGLGFGQETADHEGAHAGASALLDRGGAGFEDYECNDTEVSTFLAAYGLPSLHWKGHFGYGEVCDTNNVVWFYPRMDTNGAFDINANACHRLSLWTETACSVQVRRVNSAEEAVEYLKQLPPDSVRHVVLGGHGNGHSLVWGAGINLVGVETEEHGVPMGRVVKFNHDFVTLSKLRRRIVNGSIGFVSRVDGAGDAYVHFDYWLYDRQWVDGKDFRDVEVQASPMTDLLHWLHVVLQQHGSIFLDSCLSASPEHKPNLAQYVAERVGKGVRVIGSKVSFSKVEVKRVGAWHASIGVSDLKHMQQVYVNADARCPNFTKSTAPDRDGNCVCTVACRTRTGGLCPMAYGLTSGSKFLPFCMEAWADDQCECLPKTNRTGAAEKSARPLPLAMAVLCLVASGMTQLG